MERPISIDGASEEQQIEQFWEKHIATMSFFHGTSMEFLPSIMKHGLSSNPELRFWTQSDLELLKEVCVVTGGNPQAEYQPSPRVHISHDVSSAVDFAINGPEFLEEALLPYEYRRNKIPDSRRDLAISYDALHQRIVEFKSRHKPALLVVNGSSQAIAAHLRQNFPDVYQLLTDINYFKSRVPSLKIDDLSLEGSLFEIRDDFMAEHLSDMYIDGTIPATDFSIVSGEEFFHLNA